MTDGRNTSGYDSLFESVRGIAESVHAFNHDALSDIQKPVGVPGYKQEGFSPWGQGGWLTALSEREARK